LFDLHSFPTRRSSDLQENVRANLVRNAQIPSRVIRARILPEIGRAQLVHEANLVRALLMVAVDVEEPSLRRIEDGARELAIVARSEEHTSELQSLRHL